MSVAQTKFRERLEEASELGKMLHEATGSKPGRREQRYRILHKSAVVLLCGAFEEYCESVVTEAVHSLSQGPPDRIPNALQRSVINQLEVKKDKNDLRVWQFAGNGWRLLIQSYVDLRVDNFNTPNSANVTTLFNDLLGIEDVTVFWKWQKMSATNARSFLDTSLEDRHQVAHGKHDELGVTERSVNDLAGFLSRIVEKTDNQVLTHLESILGTPPW